MKDIKVYLKEELKSFESNFNGAVKSKVSLLDNIMKYIVRTKGKQLRPIFVILSARLCGPVTEQTYRAASLIELLHTATLVHDDVVDDSSRRRGFFSINALWKNKIAVLVGDYLLSKGLLLALTNGDFRVLEILATAVKDMSEGELLQAEKARRLDITEEIYFDIIRCKTASLISSACSAGAWSASQDDQLTERFRVFGEKIGIAFQIRDDLFDYGKADVGKPTGNDIKEKKMTLPLIYTLQHCDKSTKAKIIRIFKHPIQVKEEVRFIIDTVIAHGGIRYAEQKMQEIIDSAIQVLHELPDSEDRRQMEVLVHYITDRKY
ncbi:MAG TPA: polyprenyl synthetase family protein [Chitinophagaceae bacterium]|nr:polyprenyl synthetase family protein [Chitinophagaceae bacterium]